MKNIYKYVITLYDENKESYIDLYNDNEYTEQQFKQHLNKCISIVLDNKSNELMFLNIDDNRYKRLDNYIDEIIKTLKDFFDYYTCVLRNTNVNIYLYSDGMFKNEDHYNKDTYDVLIDSDIYREIKVEIDKRVI
jgi:hypothetical protein